MWWGETISHYKAKTLEVKQRKAVKCPEEVYTQKKNTSMKGENEVRQKKIFDLMVHDLRLTDIKEQTLKGHCHQKKC